jgi:RimJ/RimL family protein N-acetyltransferase
MLAPRVMGRSAASAERVDQLRLRPATMDDARFLFRVRNDPVTRKNSFRQNELRYSDHRAWLASKLEDPKRRVRLFVALLVKGRGELEPIGQVRFDCDQRLARAEISIALAARFRGRGLATPLLVRALAQTPRALGRVLARVRVENTASLKVFERTGFRRHGAVRKRPAPHVVLVWKRRMHL